MAKIGIFDSGVGGLSVLKEIRKALPAGQFIYFADNANCPYGEKSADFIIDRARQISETLIKRGAEIIVLACNTATAVAISTLREEFEIPFIGMEPALKPAAHMTHSGVVGVLATAGTLSASKYKNTKEKYVGDAKIVEQVGHGFVELVEAMTLAGPQAERVVRASLGPLLDAGADTIVLGCTHYPFLLPTMHKVAALYPKQSQSLSFIDPAEAVARRLCSVINEKSIKIADDFGSTELLSSGDDKVLKSLYDTL